MTIYIGLILRRQLRCDLFCKQNQADDYRTKVYPMIRFRHT